MLGHKAGNASRFWRRCSGLIQLPVGAIKRFGKDGDAIWRVVWKSDCGDAEREDEKEHLLEAGKVYKVFAKIHIKKSNKFPIYFVYPWYMVGI